MKHFIVIHRVRYFDKVVRKLLRYYATIPYGDKLARSDYIRTLLIGSCKVTWFQVNSYPSFQSIHFILKLADYKHIRKHCSFVEDSYNIQALSEAGGKD